MIFYFYILYLHNKLYIIILISNNIVIGASFLFLVAFCFCGKYTIKKRKRDENDSISSTQNAKLLDRNDSNHYSEQKYKTFNDKNNIEILNIPTQGTSLLSYTYFQK